MQPGLSETRVAASASMARMTSIAAAMRPSSRHASITVKRSPSGMPVRARMSAKSMCATVRVPSCA